MKLLFTFILPLTIMIFSVEALDLAIVAWLYLAIPKPQKQVVIING